MTIGRGLLGEVVEDDQRVLTLPHEVLRDGRRRVRSDVLHRRRVGRAGDDHHRVVHGAMLGERLDYARDLARSLPDGAVDTDDAGALLVDDRVERNRGLS